MQRIIVIGTTGSGKTTLARRLSALLGLPHAEQDAWQHLPGWQTAPPEDFRAAVDAFTAQPAWVTDGNYSLAQDISWPRADTVVWLDYPAPTVFWQLLRRTLRRIWHQEELWNGNVERWDALLAKDGLLAWFFKTHWRRRRSTPAALDRYPHLYVVRLQSPAQAERWLKRLAALKAAGELGRPPASPRSGVNP